MVKFFQMGLSGTLLMMSWAFQRGIFVAQKLISDNYFDAQRLLFSWSGLSSYQKWFEVVHLNGNPFVK